MSRGGVPRALPLLLALASVASAAVAGIPALVGGDPEPNPVEVVTPVLSVRRVPELTTRVVADRRLRSELDALIADPRWAGTRWCLSVTDPDGHRVVDHGSGRPLIPASTIKLVTAATALERMGPDATYTTEVRGEVGEGGGVANLWLVGVGDPLLATDEFADAAGWSTPPRDFTPIRELADRIYNAGVRSVGRVLGDESRYDTTRYLPSWKPTYATNPEVGPQSALVVNEGFVQWRSRAIPSDAPATYAAGVLAALLEDRGIPVGGVGQARTPPDLPLVAEIQSPPLTNLLRVVLQDSDNLAAELLVKEMGARFGEGGSTSAGMAVLSEHLRRHGPAAEGFAGSDGSGLDRGNLLTCDLLQAVLADAGPEGQLGLAMPESGRSGTLSRRFLGTDAEGDVRAKTGSLNGVVGLAGWTTGHDGRRLQFAMIANDLPTDALGFALQDAVAVTLAAHPRAPAPDEVAPGPVVRRGDAGLVAGPATLGR